MNNKILYFLFNSNANNTIPIHATIAPLENEKRKAAPTIKSKKQLMFLFLLQKLKIKNEVNNNNEADSSNGSAKKAAYLGDEPCDSKDQLNPKFPCGSISLTTVL